MPTNSKASPSASSIRPDFISGGVSHSSKHGAMIASLARLPSHHVSHVGHTAERYQIAGHSALVVQAGTLSTRGRGEPNAINVLRLARPRITIERHTWDDGARTFQPSWRGAFQHGDGGWSATGS